MHARPLDYIDVLVLHRACAPCSCMFIAHGRHDITWFAYNVNDIIMTSLAFMFHSWHVGMRCHALIGVYVA